MNAYRFKWKDQPPGLIDATVLRPDRLTSLSKRELAAKIIRCGNRNYPLGEVFDIQADAAQPEGSLHIPGSSLYRGLGTGMAAGTLIVDGHAGEAVGCGMTGGEVFVNGAAGHLTAAAMSGGLIVVEGDVGDTLGGPPLGELRGMTGGEVLVLGNAGAYAATRQRGGVIAVSGGVGECPGYKMLAGTLVIGEGETHSPGLGMLRGTIIALKSAPTVLPSFRPDGLVQPVVLRLLWRRLQQLKFPLPSGLDEARFESFSGDMLSGHRGEILYRRSE